MTTRRGPLGDIPLIALTVIFGVRIDYFSLVGMLRNIGDVGKVLQVKRTIAYTLLLMMCLSSAPAHADSTAQQAPGEISQFVNGIINESVNANTLFASQESIATGRFTQRKNGQPDKDYTTIRLPGEFALGDMSNTVRLYVQGNGALLRTTAGYNPPDALGEADFTVTSLFALSAGAGALIKISESWTFAAGASLTYSHIKNRYDFNNLYSQTYLQQYESDLFNWVMDVFTYAPSLKLFYQRDMGFAVLNYQISYTYLLNDTISDDSPSIDVNSSTGLCSNRFDLLIPTDAVIQSSSLFLRPIFQWNNISGNAVAGLGLRDLYEVGADIVAKVLDTHSFISTLTVGASYVTGDSFEGYHIGAGVTF
jgi:Solitary outer membrane autotransporter beta-barrel domain